MPELDPQQNSAQQPLPLPPQQAQRSLVYPPPAQEAPAGEDTFSAQDLSELYQAQQQLKAQNDPRAETLRNFIATQGLAKLHPQDKEHVEGIAKAWNWLNKGLIDKETFVGAMSGMTPDQLNAALASYPEESPIHAALREFTRGAIQDTAATTSSFTSPLAIGTVATGAASKIPGAAGEVARAVSGAAATGFAAKGVEDVGEAGLENTPEAWQKRLQGAAMATGGTAGALESGLPQRAAASTSAAVNRMGTAAEAGRAAKQANNFAAALEMGGRAEKGVDAFAHVAQPILDDFRSEAANQGIAEKDFDGRNGYQAARKITAAVRSSYDQAYQQLIEPLRNETAGQLPQQVAADLTSKLKGDAALMDELTNSHHLLEVQNLRAAIKNARTIGDLDDLRITLNRLAAKYEAKTGGQQYTSPLLQEALSSAADSIRNRLYPEMAKRYGGLAANGESIGITEADIRALQKRHGAAIKADSMMEQTANAISSRASAEAAKPGIVARFRGMGYRATMGRTEHAAAGVMEKLFPPSEVELFNTRMKRVVKGSKPGTISKPQQPLEGEYVDGKTEPDLRSTVAQPKLKAAPPVLTPEAPKQLQGGATQALPAGQYEAPPSPLAEPKQLPETGTHGIPLKAVEPEPMDVLRARSNVVRDPNTGRMRRQHVTSGAGAAEPKYYGSENKLVTLEEYEAARKAFLDKATSPHAGIDPTMLADMTKVGLFHLEAGARQFNHWAAKMEAELGKKARPYLKQIWDEINRTAPTFYSKAEQVATEKLPARMLPSQVLSTLRNAGVPKEELEYSGVEQWLGEQKGSVSKQQVLDYLDKNGIKVGIKVLGPLSVEETEKLDSLDARLRNPATRHSLTPDERAAYDQLTDRENRLAYKPKFDQWQEPGGQNYREMLITLTLRGEAAAIAERRGYGATNTDLGIFNGGHFDELNVLAHLRFNDRVDAAGKKVMFLEEVQSDWHQKGRNEGYTKVRPAVLPNDFSIVDKAERIGATNATDKFIVLDAEGKPFASSNTRQQAIENALDRLANKAGGVPNAPFKNSWHELALKQALRYAAEHGYDKLAWTTGEMQADRYDLSKQVGRVEYTPATQQLVAYEAGYEPGFTSEPRPLVDKKVSPENLADYIGKDAARKLLSTELSSGGYHALQGEDLKVGGEFHKLLYDKKIPQFLNQYAKKWSARVGETIINAASKDYDVAKRPFNDGWDAILNGKTVATFATREEAVKWTTQEHKPVKVPAIEITPAMRRDVLKKGQPIAESTQKSEFANA